ncbi:MULTISPECIES: MFS transporter [Staphylococcus]|jgi:DHA2 family multidrug resistance protein-like MFS transporter|uniref:Quinolone resistance protein NorB n=1 Tax=Staphylococcus nepalensis TaxID=214473 RepID=A0ABS3KYB2_9STAP|nr:MULTISPECIES: MFS transporter [Staphylococcus]ATH59201.1 quinolone resistance protein [Staphylococcus nepalensis]ATH64293.1 quinolone resistance protein [Staphylococcus nepalensis]AWI43652.1 quinolone resistance protein [Staphylococcus nepalensis]MBO1205499.1 MFS transporter [Staphylococcus nepalensis]MBO1212528.1 MFS transporter [Staphylococcus nepalensis]
MTQQGNVQTYRGDNKLILGIVLGVVTFWLFAQSLLNVVPTLQQSFDSNIGTISIAVSITALFSGMFVVGAGSLADKVGRVKITYIGLWLSIIGSLLIIISNLPVLLILGRVIQGLSAAAIMPSTLAIMKTYFEGKDRQRALSYWSIGSWGGSGLASLFGGMVATFIGWRWIFILSIIIALMAMLLIKGTPETKSDNTTDLKFDFTGLILFVVMMLSINIVITQSGTFGIVSPLILGLIIVFVLTTMYFIKIENKKRNPLIDFKLFKNKAYTGATLSNFLLNGVAGALLVANTFVQKGLGFNAFQTGLLSITYLVTVLLMIRVGEKVLQKVGAKKPMLLGTTFNMIGIILISLTFLPSVLYVIVCIIGYLLYGLGLGFYATPSTDMAISNSPEDKVGVASGIYKMASSLGGAFGIALSGALYGVVTAATNVQIGALAGLWLNVIMALLSFVIILLTVPSFKKQMKA